MAISFGKNPQGSRLWTGLSTDIKPNAANGLGPETPLPNDVFYETDTNNEFLYVNRAWIAYIPQLGGITVTPSGTQNIQGVVNGTPVTTQQATTGTAGVTFLNAVTTTGAGATYTNAAGYTAHDLQITTTSSPTYTINLEGSLDNSNWTVLDTITSSSTTPNQIASAGFYPYLRANLTALSGGTLTALYSGAISEAPTVSIAGQVAGKAGLLVQGTDLNGVAQSVSVDAAGAASTKAVAVQGIASGVAVPVSTSNPSAASILVGRQTFTSTTGATTLITITAGKTWVGTIGASVSAAEVAAGTAQPQATATFTTTGAGTTPAAGTYFVVDARAGANAATGVVGNGVANFGSSSDFVISCASGTCTLAVAATCVGTSALVDAFAHGVQT